MGGGADDGRILRHVFDHGGVGADFGVLPTVMGPRTCAPAPMTTLSSTVGWRLPLLPP